MGNKRRGRTSVRLSDGTEKLLVLDANAMAELDDLFGESALSYLNEGKHLGFKTVRTILWVGMRSAGSSFKEADVGRLMDTTQFEYYLGVVKDAVALAMRGKTFAEAAADAAEVEDEDPLAPTDETPQVAGTGTG